MRQLKGETQEHSAVRGLALGGPYAERRAPCSCIDGTR